MLIGAGRAAALALREFSGSSYSENRVVCLIDDDAAKQGRYLQGVKIVGGQASIVEAAQNITLTKSFLRSHPQPINSERSCLRNGRKPVAGLRRCRAFVSWQTAR